MAGLTYTVGREKKNDISPVTDLSVSKTHAKITVRRGRGPRPEVILEDVGSTFGSHLQSAPTFSGVSPPQRTLREGEPYQMKENDQVRFGSFSSTLRLVWWEFLVPSRNLLERLESIEARLRLEKEMTDRTSHLMTDSLSLSLTLVKCLARSCP